MGVLCETLGNRDRKEDAQISSYEWMHQVFYPPWAMISDEKITRIEKELSENWKGILRYLQVEDIRVPNSNDIWS